MESSAERTFQKQKERGGQCILRQVTSHISFTEKILYRESKRFAEHLSAYQIQYLAELPAQKLGRIQQIENSDLIVCNSQHVYNTFTAEGVSRHKLVYVPTGCPPTAMPGDRPGSGNGKLQFLYAGTLCLRKGTLRLLAAWEEARIFKHAKLILVGSTEFDPAIFHNKDGVVFRGKVSKTHMAELLKTSDVFVLPTLAEGRSHAVLEAVAAGLPVITTRESGCDDVVSDGANGLIVDFDKSDSLKTALCWCLDNRDKLPDMGELSLQRAKSWSVEASDKAHLNILKNFSLKGNVRN